MDSLASPFSESKDLLFCGVGECPGTEAADYARQKAGPSTSLGMTEWRRDEE